MRHKDRSYSARKRTEGRPTTSKQARVAKASGGGDGADAGKSGKARASDKKFSMSLRSAKKLMRKVAKAAAAKRATAKILQKAKAQTSGKAAKAAKISKAASRMQVEKVQTANGKTYFISGATAPSRGRWVLVRYRKQQVWVPFAAWFGQGNEALQLLRSAGIVIIGSSREFRDAVDRLKRFPPRLLFERPGWTGLYFAYPDGRLFLGGTKKEDAAALFAPTQKAGRNRSYAGDIDGWKTDVAEYAVGHVYPSFALMIGFAAPILGRIDRTDNFGFEFYGPAGVGKSTLQLMLGSVAGPVFDSGSGTYVRSCNATINGIETMMVNHQHMPFVLDEAGSLTASATRDSGGRMIAELAFHLADGHVKSRWQSATQELIRFVFVMSTNVRVLDAVGRLPALQVQAIVDRLSTIEIKADRPHKTFDFLPEGFESGHALAAKIREGMRANYGVALPHFLRRLVREQLKDGPALARRIQQGLRFFRTRVGVDENDGSATRVADQFGLVYVAGVLAQEYGALPEGIDCLGAVRACYLLHRASSRPLAPPLERLRAIRHRRDTIDLDSPDAASLTDEQLAAASAYLKTNRKSGEIELLLTPARKASEFSDWNTARHELTALGVLRPDKKRRNAKRALRAGESRRSFYCFVLPPAET